MTTPRLTLLRQFDTHRLIPSRHSPPGASVLTGIAEDDEHLRTLIALDAATNDRLLGEHQRLPGIGVEELVFSVPHAAVVNAAFCHAHPLGRRFNGPDRGAWYAAFAVETSLAEVSFHRSVHLAEIGRFHDTATFDEFLADCSASLHDLRAPGDQCAAYLDADSYVEPQLLAERLLEAGALGVVHPSVRHAGGTCVATFRPALVMNVRRARTYRLTWTGSPAPVVSEGSSHVTSS